MSKVVAGYRVERLLEEIEKLMRDYRDAEELFVAEISPGAAGNHQVEEVAEYFGLDVDCSEEWAWEEVEDAVARIADELNAALQEVKPGFPATVYFGWLEGDNSFGLIAIVNSWEVCA